jgi:uncharacterized integral membrane protein
MVLVVFFNGYYYSIYSSGIRHSDIKILQYTTIIDISLGTLAAALDGLRSENTCKPFTFILLAMSICYTIYHIYLRPFEGKFETWSTISKTIGQCMLSLIACIIVFLEKDLSYQLEIVGTVLIAYLPIEFVIVKLIDRFYIEDLPPILNIVDDDIL